MGDQVVLHQRDELGPVPPENPLVRNRSAVYILGILQILLGLGIIAVETGALIMFHQPYTPGYPISYVGIWTGIFAILTGVVQVLAGKKTISPHRRRRLFAVGLGTAIVCIIQAIVLFALTTYNIYLVRAEIARREEEIRAEPSGAYFSVDNLKYLAMMRSVVALVYFSLAVMALVSTVLDCCNTCGKNNRSAGAPDQVVYTSVDGNQVKQIKIYNKSHHIKS